MGSVIVSYNMEVYIEKEEKPITEKPITENKIKKEFTETQKELRKGWYR